MRRRRLGVHASRRALVTIGALLALAVVLVASLALGSKLFTPAELWAALPRGAESEAHTILFDQRLPRTVLGVVAGLGLGLAGSIMQSLTRNPLADPGVLGVNAGAAFAVALSVGWLGVDSMPSMVLAALVGAGAVTLAVYGLARRGGDDTIGLTLSGVALGAVLLGATNGLALAAPDTFSSIRAWSAGSVQGRDLRDALPVVPVVLLGAIIAFAVTRSLDAVALGDDTAASLGVDLRRTRGWSVVAITLLAGAATAAAGPISFVGLIVAHVGRTLLGPDVRRLAVFSAIAGPLLVVGADIAARFLLWPSELAIGIVTAAVGAPVLLAVVLRARSLT